MAEVKPVRLQLSRLKGSDIHRLSRETNGLECVVVTRQSKRWGNPRRVGMYQGYTNANAVRDYRRWLDRGFGTRSWEMVYGKPPTIKEIRKHLAGKNLACTCGAEEDCHADVLLDLANPTPSGGD